MINSIFIRLCLCALSFSSPLVFGAEDPDKSYQFLQQQEEINSYFKSEKEYERMELVKMVNYGASGMVCLAEEKSRFGRRVKQYAVKIELWGKEDSHEIFEDEISYLSKLRSAQRREKKGQNVMTHLFHFTIKDKTHIVVSEWAGGGDLFNYQKDCRSFTNKEFLALAKSMGRALSFIHGEGFVHNDVKLENVLLPADLDFKKAKLIDFGLTRMIGCQDGAISGTPCYLSPEELMRSPANAKSDLWSLGIMFSFLVGIQNFPMRQDAFSRDDWFMTLYAQMVREGEKSKEEFMDNFKSSSLPIAIAILNGLLQINVRHRWGDDELLSHLDKLPKKLYR